MFNVRRAARFVTYAAIGAVGTLAQYAVLVGAVDLRVAGPVAGSVAGAVVGAVVNYALNYRITFKSNARHTAALPKFAMTAGAGILVNALVMACLTGPVGIHYLIAQLIATAVVLLLTFSVNSVWTFKARETSAGVGQ
ncbi:GtrA family protein [Paraburkholderia sp. J67]|uniref:GtrA family protein n=1 Tax=Paraburkholderia sp. J67 TaxID=2805435 RepID=UPI002ABD9469|nr:GtrA family protein [Paraburkholderia sp. J67]